MPSVIKRLYHRGAEVHRGQARPLQIFFLCGIVGVDLHVLCGQVSGEESYRMAAAPKLHTNIAHRLREIAVSLALVERPRDAVTAYFLAANKNLHASGIDRHAASSHCRENASTIRIGSGPSRFDKQGVSNRSRDQ